MTDTPPSAPSALRALAERVGILSEYIDQTGRETRTTPDATRVAILAAMGFDASTEAQAARALRELDEREAARAVAPVRVLVHGERPALGARDSTLVLESGSEADLAGDIPLGYHTVHVGEETQTLIVVPPRCVVPDRPVAGVIANLYGVRGERDWGIGDFGDLAELAEWSAGCGAAFVGVNPLHALRNRGHDISPYGPVSRLFRNPIYIDVEQVPELADREPAASDARALVDAEETRAALAALRASPRVEYERVWTLKRRALALLHRAFALAHRDADTARGRAYRAYVQREGEPLAQFALWCALEEHFTREGEFPPPWQSWPAPYREPGSPEVAAFGEAHAEAIDFHRWLQFECDRQLGDAAQRGRDAGLSIGLYQDLAIGASPTSADVWAYPHLFLRGIAIGAPPDMYASQGQNWGLPPIGPRRLREDRYAFWIALLRATLGHAGALRIDHVLGLFRQFWIPDGMSGRDGAYVRFPTEEMLGILALESVRHRAVIVGEDLGTVPPEVPGVLARWGVLSSRVLFFEREHDGRFRAAGAYEPLALATADTHDMATITGFWEGRDIALRRHAGLLEGEDAERRARDERERERHWLVERLAADHALENGHAPASAAELIAAVHRFLARTPALLVGLGLDDLVGEPDPVNLPGIGPDVYPSWTRRLSMSLDEARRDPRVSAALVTAR